MNKKQKTQQWELRAEKKEALQEDDAA